MGLEPSTEPSTFMIMRERHKQELLKMIDQYNGDGVGEITKILREIIEEGNGEIKQLYKCHY